jgi:GT2 family glycosyltransferase
MSPETETRDDVQPADGLETWEVSASIVTYDSDGEELRVLLAALSSGSRCVRTTVVDNSPEDRLRQLVEASGVVYRKPPRNLGYGRGHNLALGTSLNSTKYHLIVNPDISFDEDVVDHLFRFMEDHPDVGLVMPRILYPDGSEQRLCKRLPSPVDLVIRRFLRLEGANLFKKRCDRYEMRDVDLSIPREVPSLSGCFMFIRTEVLREVGLFDEKFFMYLEDVDLCRRIGRRSKTVFYPAVSVRHGYAKGSYRSIKLLFYHVISAITYFAKWAWFNDPERDELNRRTGAIG